MRLSENHMDEVFQSVADSVALPSAIGMVMMAGDLFGASRSAFLFLGGAFLFPGGALFQHLCFLVGSSFV